MVALELFGYVLRLGLALFGFLSLVPALGLVDVADGERGRGTEISFAVFLILCAVFLQ